MASQGTSPPGDSTPAPPPSASILFGVGRHRGERVGKAISSALSPTPSHAASFRCRLQWADPGIKPDPERLSVIMPFTKRSSLHKKVFAPRADQIC